MLRKDVHRQYLYNCIKAIFSDAIGKYLAFKWETACYFFYDLPRFSTDIDLDIIMPTSTNIDTQMSMLLQAFGTVKEGHHIILSYGDTDTNIHIDINRRIWKANRYEIRNFFGTDIRVQTIDTIVANKLITLVERGAHRDFFDVYHFLTKAYPINEAVILERTWAWLHALWKRILDMTDTLPTKFNILQSLWETLYDDKQKARVKTQLISELKGIVTMRMMR